MKLPGQVAAAEAASRAVAARCMRIRGGVLAKVQGSGEMNGGTSDKIELTASCVVRFLIRNISTLYTNSSKI